MIPLTSNRSLMLFLIGLLAILVQSALLKFLMPAGIVPDFHLLLTVFIACADPSSRGALLAFLLGLQSDLASGILLGPMAGTLVVIFMLVTLVTQNIFTETTLAAVFTVFVSTFLARFLFILLMNQFSLVAPFLTWGLLWTGILNAAITPIFFSWLKRFRQRDGDSYRFSGRGRRGVI